MRPGDMALAEAERAWYKWLITWGTKSRYSHVRLVVDTHGTVVEALDGGVQLGSIRVTDVVLSPPLTDEQRELVIHYAHALVGTPYGWKDVIILGLAQVGVRLPYLRRELARPDRLFCSQLVDLVWKRAGFHAFDDGRKSQNVSPGDLADLALRGGWPSILDTTNRKTSA